MASKQQVREQQAKATHEVTRLYQRLWSGHSGTTTRRGIALGSIVDAAIALADQDGLEAVSMRAVADQVGIPAMSLYSHVGGKTELVALMQDAVLRGLYALPLPGGVVGWRAGLSMVAAHNRVLFQNHPWLLRLGGPRPVLGPHACRKYEVELGPLDGSGLADVAIDGALSLVLGHVAGTARARFAQQANASARLSDADWWRVVATTLEQHMDSAEYPRSSRIGEAAAHAYGGIYSDDQAFAFGLDRILDGISLLIECS